MAKRRQQTVAPRQAQVHDSDSCVACRAEVVLAKSAPDGEASLRQRFPNGTNPLAIVGTCGDARFDLAHTRVDEGTGEHDSIGVGHFA